jgi:hypothetical protein
MKAGQIAGIVGREKQYVREKVKLGRRLNPRNFLM